MVGVLTKKYFGLPVWAWSLGVVALVAVGGTPLIVSAIERRRLDALHPEMRRRVERWIVAVRAAGYDVKVMETQRDAERQKDLQAGGASTVKTSYHQSGVAVDFAVIKDPSGSITPYKETDRELAALRYVASLAKPLGMRWGGDWKSFKDGYHLEMDTPVSMQVALTRYEAQGPNWQPLTGLSGSGLFSLSTGPQRYVREV